MSQEIIPSSGERNIETLSPALEQAERLRNSTEKTVEQSPEQRAERQEKARKDT